MTPANAKTVLLALATPSSNTTTTANVDTLGFDFCRISIFAAISNAPAILKVEHSDSASSGFGTINLTGGTDFTIATNNSSATTTAHYIFDIDTKGLKRYLRVTHTPAAAVSTTTSLWLAVADLGRPSTGVATAAAAGAVNYLTLPSAT